MIKDPKVQIKVLFGFRVFLWIVAFLLTAYWMWYSDHLYKKEIFDPYEYAALMRPVLYPCIGFAIIAIAVSFALYALSKKIKKEMKQNELQELAEADKP